ncbi:hypothetical protein HRI_005038200 [Hibiscus trionum]|uniref:Uncharacterized protein n=1 Tax=Hibiscus trionum TaxID=183268 RepID=A0A9W7MSS4_HIBTR|nr:hypothetical protein HRI_005038200 [Hibiscus trionum]
MTQVEDKTGAAISQDSHFSDVFSILVKAMQRGNQQNDVEKGRKSFRKNGFHRIRDGGEADRQWQKAKRGVREMMKGEVWRKMILMRGKCRPLNGSGVIQYDEDGVLIPESHHI